MERRRSAGNPKEALVRILGPSGAPMGTGCYALNGLVVTCAHVVRDVLSVKKEDQERLKGALPQGRIRLDFPFLPKQRDAAGRDVHPSFEAEVAPGGWGWMDAISHETDIAVLRLLGDAPFDHGRLFATADSLNQDIAVFAHGFPSPVPYGWPVNGTIKAHGDQPGGLRVLSYKDSSYLFNPGFSGAPVFFDHGAEAAGLFIGAPHYDKEAQRGPNEVALVIPASRVMAMLNAMQRSDAAPRSPQALARAEAYVPLLQERVRQARPLGNDTRLCDGLAFALERIDRAIRSGLTADAINGFARTVAHLERFRGEAAACGLEDRLTILQFAEVRAALDGLRRKYPGIETSDAAQASVGNDLKDELAHRDERLTLLIAIENRLQAVRDETLRMPETLRAQACAALEDLWLELHQNPLRLAVLDRVRAELEALDRSLFHALIAQCQTLMGVYAERLPDLAVFRDFPEGPEMIVIPAGRFLMGSPEDEPERLDGEGPRHEATIQKRFAIGRSAVTFEEWDFAVAAGGCGAIGRTIKDGDAAGVPPSM